MITRTNWVVWFHSSSGSTRDPGGRDLSAGRHHSSVTQGMLPTPPHPTRPPGDEWTNGARWNDTVFDWAISVISTKPSVPPFTHTHTYTHGRTVVVVATSADWRKSGRPTHVVGPLIYCYSSFRIWAHHVTEYDYRAHGGKGAFPVERRPFISNRKLNHAIGGLTAKVDRRITAGKVWRRRVMILRSSSDTRRLCRDDELPWPWSPCRVGTASLPRPRMSAKRKFEGRIPNGKQRADIPNLTMTLAINRKTSL